jgi:hypothetical protein
MLVKIEIDDVEDDGRAAPPNLDERWSVTKSLSSRTPPLWEHFFTCLLSPNGNKFQAHELKMLILSLPFLNLDDDPHLMVSFHGLYEILVLMNAHEKIHNQWQSVTKSGGVGVKKTFGHQINSSC